LAASDEASRIFWTRAFELRAFKMDETAQKWKDNGNIMDDAIK